MSSLKIKAALEVALNGLSPPLATAWENTAFTPVLGTPYQYVRFLGFIPNNVEFGESHQIDGFFQIDLMYPLLEGTGNILARAELIKALFKVGSSFTNNGLVVNITETPQIGSGQNDGDRWKIVVRIYYSAWVMIN
jgi:hypothetical protein